MSDDEEIEISFSGPGSVDIDLSGDDSPDKKGTTPGDEEPPTSPSPGVNPNPNPNNYTRGDFVFDSSDTDLIQKMEIRGNNGVDEVDSDVETKYLLTGPSYTTPTDIIQLDNPSLYSKVTETTIRYNVTEIAKYVAQLHEGGHEPNLVVSVHTHPSGSTYPSDMDRNDARALERALGRYFDDFEFLQGIHGLQERSTPSSSQLREVHREEGSIWWYGENRKHEIAIYDGGFNPEPEVMVE
jgi:hypothetical protein